MKLMELELVTKEPKAERNKRLAAALRRNLSRRKAAGRSATSDAVQPDRDELAETADSVTKKQ